MSDDFDPDRLFQNMRDNLRQAPVTPATAVRQRGHQRQVRARVLTATTAVVLVTGGAGIAFASGHDTRDRSVTPAATTSISTPTATPAAAPTVKTPGPAPTAVPPAGQATAPATPQSSATTHSMPPSAVTKTPTTTPATTPVTTPATTPPGALPTAPAEYITVTVTVVPGKGSFTWQSTGSGMVAQTYDASTHKAVPGLVQFRSEVVALDGHDFDGADGGNTNCPAGSPIVHAAFTHKSQAPVVAKAGAHTLTVTVKSCDGVIGSKSIQFTVR